MSSNIADIINQLPEDNITTKALASLDFAIPGEWQNTVGFDNMITLVTGETDSAIVQQIRDRAIALFNDPNEGYQSALWFYETVDHASAAHGSSVMSSLVSESISFLGFLGNLAPKPDKAQAFDFLIKLVVEVAGFCQLNGLVGDSIGDFIVALTDYSDESLARMAAIICFDGMAPLGPDFLAKVAAQLDSSSSGDWENHPTFKSVQAMMPGGNTNGRVHFIGDVLSATSGWIESFVADRGITQDGVVSQLKTFIDDFQDDKAEYIGAFLDVTALYVEHTGKQTIARHLINRAYSEM